MHVPLPHCPCFVFLAISQEFYNPTGNYPKNTIQPGSYIQFNMDDKDWATLRRNFDLPSIFTRDADWFADCLGSRALIDEFTKKLHWRMTLIGTKGAGMFNHYDVLRTSSWQAQMTGAKRWHICAPDQRPYLYGAGKVCLLLILASLHHSCVAFHFFWVFFVCFCLLKVVFCHSFHPDLHLLFAYVFLCVCAGGLFLPRLRRIPVVPSRTVLGRCRARGRDDLLPPGLLAPDGKSRGRQTRSMSKH